jgi:hypothetical protein
MKKRRPPLYMEIRNSGWDSRLKSGCTANPLYIFQKKPENRKKQLYLGRNLARLTRAFPPAAIASCFARNFFGQISIIKNLYQEAKHLTRTV